MRETIISPKEMKIEFIRATSGEGYERQRAGSELRPAEASYSGWASSIIIKGDKGYWGETFEISVQGRP